MRDIPEGWKLVPIRATITMHNAAALRYNKKPTMTIDDDGTLRLHHWPLDMSEVYACMLAAAPEPPST